MENPNNRIVAAGRLEENLELSHEVMNEPFYTGTLLVKRLSGAVDRLPVTIPGKLLAVSEIDHEKLMLLSGQVRSYNKVIDGNGRLMVTMFVQSMTDTVSQSFTSGRHWSKIFWHTPRIKASSVCLNGFRLTSSVTFLYIRVTPFL